MSLHQQLNGVLEQWAQFDPPVKPTFAAGLSRAEIDYATKDLSFRLPEDVYEFYMWHDGTVNTNLLPYFYLMSLDEAIYHYNNAPELFIDLVEEVHDSGVLARKGECVECCFPLFFDAGGTVLTLPCSKRAQSGELLIAWDENPPEIVYQNIESLINTVVTASETGAYFLPHEGLDIVDVDEEKWRLAAQKCNPDINYWLNN